jgi:8-oxo-dGTP diphosphatase
MLNLDVVAAVLVDDQGRILLQQRSAASHQGGLWEFPGGKLEPGEEGLAGLRRELLEELGVQIQSASPLIKVDHQYPDRHVSMAVWFKCRYSGAVTAREGQPLRWVHAQRLSEYPMPAADVPVVAAIMQLKESL